MLNAKLQTLTHFSISCTGVLNTHQQTAVCKQGNQVCWRYRLFLLQECGFTGRQYTFEDVRIKSRNLNRALRKKLKLQRGDVVALLLPNIPEFPICVFATFLAGLKLTTLNPGYTPGNFWATGQIDREIIALARVQHCITMYTTPNEICWCLH